VNHFPVGSASRPCMVQYAQTHRTQSFNAAFKAADKENKKLSYR